MATIVTRSGKGSALTHTEMDANFTNLNNDKLESKYSGSTKIATTSTGIDVTGDITCNNLNLADGIGHIGDADTYFSFENNLLNIYSGGTNTFTANDGKVGIGTSSPDTNLSVYHATDDTSINVNTGTGGSYPKKTGISFGATSTSLGGDLTFRGGAGIQAINTAASGNPTDLAFWTNHTGSPTERMRIDSSGNLLLNGTSSATSGAGTHFGKPSNTSTMPTYLYFKKTFSGTRDAVDFRHNGSKVGGIQFNNTSTSYATSSDYRLKENVVPMSGSIDRLKELKPSRFNFIADADTTVDGFLAHEVSDIVPEAISGEKDAMTTEEYEVEPAQYETITIPAVEEELDEDGNVVVEAQPERTEEQLVTEAVMGEREVPDYQGIDQAKLVPLLTSALQEAVAKIEALEARVEALENA